MNIEMKAIDELIYEVEMFEQAGVYPVQDFIDNLKVLAAKVKEETKLECSVVVNKKDTEDWYLDDSEGMWMDEPDNWLCDLYVGEVQSVKHKKYLITESDTLYAAIKWDVENEQVGTWEFFKTEEEAEKAAAYCKAMVEAARGGK
ncbi:hypothetical protein AhaeINNSZ174_05665 [Acinetobacter haemolyticus]|uniref:hypothetical protein n=1 Tax=Acinetobacter haemolyticus TaxID=29430 RepID=UPI001331EFAB|nr:hypothetical protein [Acinetobacter haemolyticus]QHI28991.1 hypothetical protein AhaeINNSZ174_05665 [Acinetobacter haemolyticus]